MRDHARGLMANEHDALESLARVAPGTAATVRAWDAGNGVLVLDDLGESNAEQLMASQDARRAVIGQVSAALAQLHSIDAERVPSLRPRREIDVDAAAEALKVPPRP